MRGVFESSRIPAARAVTATFSFPVVGWLLCRITFLSVLGRFVGKRGAKQPHRARSRSVGPLGFVWRVRPVKRDDVSPPLCQLGELCRLCRKSRMKYPEIGVFSVFGCVFGMEILHNSVDPEYAPQLTQVFFPTTMGVDWMAPTRPHTTHSAGPGHIKCKSSRPARRRRAPPAEVSRPHQNDHTDFWGPRRGPARARRGGGGCLNTLEPTPDVPRHECHRIPLKKVAPPCSVQAARA